MFVIIKIVVTRRFVCLCLWSSVQRERCLLPVVSALYVLLILVLCSGCDVWSWTNGLVFFACLVRSFACSRAFSVCLFVCDCLRRMFVYISVACLYLFIVQDFLHFSKL